ncbi:MAG: hypothetical protein EH225_13580 [Calditrichaeota bacterium]|nr:hypothetical protein [Calditrichota bacterium]RQV98203.1 MAG: hypothetical protein EH225_13580 [Calditrichota bacterium]
MNEDGLNDIGVIEEELECARLIQRKKDMSPVESPYYKIYPVQWYIFIKDRWLYDQSLNGKILSISKRELPLIGLVKSPVDYVKEFCFKRNICLMEYSDFGVQSMAYELIGFQWYQWESHGAPDPNIKYNIKVVVYRNISLEEVQKLYTVNRNKKEDYRYIEYGNVMRYIDRQMKQIDEMRTTDSDLENTDFYDDLKTTILNTSIKIATNLGQ